MPHPRPESTAMDTTIYTYIAPAGTDGGARVRRTNRLRYAVRCQHLQEVIDDGELRRPRTSTW